MGKTLIWVKYAISVLILSHHKNLNAGDYLIDDRKKNGAAKFLKGKLILFGSEQFPNWKSVAKYLFVIKIRALR